jgi:uncharacterized radical SAM superfamily Fe-S cluster-containing enzyme
VEAGIKAWMESVQGVTVDDVSISGSGDTKIKTKVKITIADVEVSKK